MGNRYSQNEGDRLQGEFSTEAAFGGGSVLVIERNRSTRELMKSVMHARYQVEAVATYEEGLRRTETASYDGVVLSLYPGECERGKQMMETVRRRHAQISIIAVMGPFLSRTPSSLLDAGFDDTLRMPFARSDFVRVLDEALEDV